MTKTMSDMQTNNNIFIVDSYTDGISFGRARDIDPTYGYCPVPLSLESEDLLGRLRSRYALHKSDNPLYDLERNLQSLSAQGLLSRATIVFGAATDPFLPFDTKFAASMKFLEIFKRYTPHRLIIQTRSPLIVLAMPVIRQLGRHVLVNVGIETFNEAVVKRYTPELPRIEERVKILKALKSFNVPTGVQIGPVLPYGDWREGAGEFAAKILELTNTVTISGLIDFAKGSRSAPYADRVAKALADDRSFHCLRRDAAQPLIKALQQKGANIGWLEAIGTLPEQLPLPLSL